MYLNGRPCVFVRVRVVCCVCGRTSSILLRSLTASREGFRSPIPAVLRHLRSERNVTQSCLWVSVKVRVRVRVRVRSKALVLGEEGDAILFVVKKNKRMFGIDCLGR